MSPLLELGRFGQSYWIDDLTRPMIDSGELQRRVTSEGLTGVTMNPAIFCAALHASDAFDRQIRQLAVHPLNGIYEALIVADVRDPCDILRPVYERMEGRDGFVSLEVSPYLAHNTQGSIAEAQTTLERGIAPESVDQDRWHVRGHCRRTRRPSQRTSNRAPVRWRHRASSRQPAQQQVLPQPDASTHVQRCSKAVDHADLLPGLFDDSRERSGMLLKPRTCRRECRAEFFARE